MVGIGRAGRARIEFYDEDDSVEVWIKHEDPRVVLATLDAMIDLLSAQRDESRESWRDRCDAFDQLDALESP